MKQRVILMLGMLAAALLLTGGVVLAKNINCTGGKCVGTKKADIITGSFGDDTIFGRGGNDRIVDDLGTTEIHGGSGNDEIIDVNRSVATIFGEKGDDSINVREGNADFDPDFVDCGPGIDTVFVDPTDTRLNCEILNPN